MASQIAHIIYTNNFFKNLDMGKISNLNRPIGKIDRDEFMLGSVFPDIRRIDCSIKRKDTHMYFPKIDLDFSGLDSFHAGWKFHLYCDMKREEILNRHNFYDLEHAGDSYGLSAKMLEDEIVYNFYDNWEKIISYFSHPPYFSTLSSISEETYRLWYVMLARYMEKQPDQKSIAVFLTKHANIDQKPALIIDSMEKLKKNPKAIEILLRVKDEII